MGRNGGFVTDVGGFVTDVGGEKEPPCPSSFSFLVGRNGGFVILIINDVPSSSPFWWAPMARRHRLVLLLLL